MNDGFMPFKGLGWAVAGLLALTAIMSGTSGSQWDAMRLRTDKTARSELQRPSLLKKLLGLGGGGTTTAPFPLDRYSVIVMPGAALPLGDCSATLPAGTALSLRSDAIRTWKP